MTALCLPNPGALSTFRIHTQFRPGLRAWTQQLHAHLPVVGRVLAGIVPPVHRYCTTISSARRAREEAHAEQDANASHLPRFRHSLQFCGKKNNRSLRGVDTGNGIQVLQRTRHGGHTLAPVCLPCAAGWRGLLLNGSGLCHPARHRRRRGQVG